MAFLGCKYFVTLSLSESRIIADFTDFEEIDCERNTSCEWVSQQIGVRNPSDKQKELLYVKSFKARILDSVENKFDISCFLWYA